MTAGVSRIGGRVHEDHDVIVRFCKLQARVLGDVLDYQSANDCFCGERDDWVEQGIWSNEQTAVAWIEQVVDDAIRSLKAERSGDG